MAESIEPNQPLGRYGELGGKKPGKRKPHRKSRTGCKQCRASRVKCDEIKPSCSYCIRHSETCSFLSTESSVVPSLSGLGLNSRTASPATRVPPESTNSPFSDPGASMLCSNLHMRDLQLLHHYTTSTAETLSQIPAHLSLWSTAMPQIALKHPFLMHGILAISALHLAHLHPDHAQEYTVLSANHENLALPMFRSEATNVNEHNCAAIFASSALVVVYALASPVDPGGFFFTHAGIDRIPEWLHLLRGLGGLMKPTHHWLAATPLAPMLLRENFGSCALHPSDELHLSGLSSLFMLPPNVSNERMQELGVYRETLSILRDSFMNPISPCEPSLPMPYIWFAFVSETYIRYVNEKRPEALVLLAYECVLLKRLEPCWFIDGLARRLMGTICENLGAEWRFWIEWPLQEID